MDKVYEFDVGRYMSNTTKNKDALHDHFYFRNGGNTVKASNFPTLHWKLCTGGSTRNQLIPHWPSGQTSVASRADGMFKLRLQSNKVLLLSDVTVRPFCQGTMTGSPMGPQAVKFSKDPTVWLLLQFGHLCGFLSLFPYFCGTFFRARGRKQNSPSTGSGRGGGTGLFSTGFGGCDPNILLRTIHHATWLWSS